MKELYNFRTIQHYKSRGFSFILNTVITEPHWETVKRKCHCRLCGGTMNKGEKRFVIVVDFEHPNVSTYYHIFVRFYFCEKHSVKEIGEALGINLDKYQ